MTKKTVKKQHDRKFAGKMLELLDNPDARKAVEVGARNNNPVFLQNPERGLIIRALPVRDHFTFPEEEFFATFAEKFADDVVTLIVNTLEARAKGLRISDAAGGGSSFTAQNIIDAAHTLGDQMGGLKAIAVHSDVYALILKQNLIDYIPDSEGRPVGTYRGMAVVVDDLMPKDDDTYTTALFGMGAVGWGMSAPRVALGTEIESKASAGNGGGQQILHSRINMAMHPAGFTWQESAVAGDSATLAELSEATNWDRVVDRKAVPLAFLKHTIIV